MHPRNAVNVPDHRQYCLLFYPTLQNSNGAFPFSLTGWSRPIRKISLRFKFSMYCWWAERIKEVWASNGQKGRCERL